MIRRCDGKDPNLIRFIPDPKHPDTPVRVPCDCGMVFDDVYHLTVYPHLEF